MWLISVKVRVYRPAALFLSQIEPNSMSTVAWFFTIAFCSIWIVNLPFAVKILYEDIQAILRWRWRQILPWAPSPEGKIKRPETAKTP